jgi:hypothetical protein
MIQNENLTEKSLTTIANPQKLSKPDTILETSKVSGSDKFPKV